MSTVIDSHQHFWTLERNDYEWLTPNLAPLYRDFGPADLEPLLVDAGIGATVLVQAAATVEETRYLLDLADQHGFVAAVVGWVDMEGGAASARLLRELSRHPKFVGVRPMIQDVDDPAWMLGSALQGTFEVMIENDLRFDALVRPIHLPYLIELLQCYPDLRTVVDHGAKPAIADERWQPWSSDIAVVADETSAFCKLSGLATEASAAQPLQDLTPYMEHLLECFGAERLMWGSDWPVVNLNSGYSQWHSAFQQWAGRLDRRSRRLIAGETAATFYGLDVSGANNA